MDQELFIIEVLSAKQKIIEKAKKRAKRIMFKLLSLVFFSGLLFFGAVSFLYRHMSAVVRSAEGMQKLNNLYHFSWGVGGITIVVLIVFLLLIWLRYHQLSRHFDQWLSQRAQQFLHNKPTSQDDDYLYFENTSTSQAFRIQKSDCQLLLRSLDDLPIYLGESKSKFGMNTFHIFLLENEPRWEKSQSSPGGYLPTKMSTLVTGFFLILLAGTIYYGRYTQPKMSSHINAASHMTMNSTNDTHIQKTNEGLLADPKQKVNLTTQKINDLKLDTETHSLYMTTDSGANWVFVPIDSQWLRFGEYTLTTGLIPEGYWMDNTYDISADFSWFIYSSGDDVRLLTSRDNGKTWQTSIITQSVQPIRYRKAVFYGNDGLFICTSASGMSAETLYIYTTMDGGITWIKSGSTMINQPVQNVSFVTTSLGFVSTRESLFYTNNGGRSFKESVLSIPENYQTGGIDLFQSPNEVTQISANTLETKFYLLKKGPIDAGKMFACLFRSTDNGETWQFVQQLSQVEQGD